MQSASKRLSQPFETGYNYDSGWGNSEQTTFVIFTLYAQHSRFDAIILVLILGLCFFAGGLRFSEQGFDASEIQSTTHYSLIKLSSSCNTDLFVVTEHQRWRCIDSSCLSFFPEQCVQ